MIKKLTLLFALVTTPVLAQASLITFTATGVSGISGFVQFDDTSFDGTSFQFLPNTAITDLSLSVFGSLFGLSDVVTTDDTIIDSTGLIPVIVNGAGFIATNGSGMEVAFFPDGFGGTATDGDASLAFGSDVFGSGVTYYPVAWVTGAVVPEPTSLALLGLGLAGLGFSRRKNPN